MPMPDQSQPMDDTERRLYSGALLNGEDPQDPKTWDEGSSLAEPPAKGPTKSFPPRKPVVPPPMNPGGVKTDKQSSGISAGEIADMAAQDLRARNVSMTPDDLNRPYGTGYNMGLHGEGKAYGE